MSESIKKLQDSFSKFPTIGQRTAGRFVFYLVRLPKDKIDELIRSIQEVRNNVKLCGFCFNPYEEQNNLCSICQSNSRNKQLLCIVEKETDLLSIEKTKKYSGFYFILGGVLSLRRHNVENLRIKELQERVKNSHKFGPRLDLKEIIIATNPTPEGKSTSLLIERSLKEISLPADIKVTHLAQGLPVGGELEYADEETLESAFEGRK